MRSYGETTGSPSGRPCWTNRGAMAEGDDILLGDLGSMGARSKATDTDGDGVSDTQERLDGTDADDASDYLLRNPKLAPDGDPRADLDLATLEREVGFDSTTLTPEGMSVGSGLSGLTNLDGSALLTGSNQTAAALGDSKLTGPGSAFDGRLGDNSLLGVQRDPLASASGEAGSTGPGSGPPTGADLGLGAPDGGLVSNDDDFDDPYEYPTAPDPGHTPPPDAPPDAERDPVDPDPDPYTPQVQTNPDADLGGGGVPVTVPGSEVSQPVNPRDGGTPQIDSSGPPPRGSGGRDPMIINPNPDSDMGNGGMPIVVPGSEVSKPVNTGFDGPPSGGPPPSGGGGGGGGDDIGLASGSSAATASSAVGAGAPGISSAGSGGGSGIQSTAIGGDDILGMIAAPAIIIPDLGRAGADAGADAVDTFAAEYLEDASFDPSTPDSIAVLDADLAGDLTPMVDEFEFARSSDLEAEAPDELATLDRDGSAIGDG